MNDMKQVANSLDRIGEEFREQPSIVADVMSEIRPAPVEQEKHHPIPLRTLMAIATAACVLVAVGMWLSRPTSLYAQTLNALKNAETVHVKGWASRIVRKWPLEKPSEQSSDEKIPVEGWYWHNGKTPISHEKFGPVVLFRDGNKLQEYQADADLLFVSDSNPKDYVERFSTMAKYLELLKEEGTKSEDLGTRTEDGVSMRGVRIHRGGDPAEFWFDTKTNLPMRYSRIQSGDGGKEFNFELTFVYDKKVPGAVASFKPPKTKHVRHGSGHNDEQLVWHRHVQDVGMRIGDTSLDEPIAILPRDSQRVYSYQYTKQTPDGKYWVLPLGHDQHFHLTVKNFVNLRVQGGGDDRAPETWRIEEGLSDIEFPRVDLVYEKETRWQDWVQFALNQVDLEYVDVQEERTFWLANHDGRVLKPWQDVLPPVPYLVREGKVRRGVVRPGIGHQLSPETMHGLFEDFNRIQNINYKADHPIIVDQTGLPRAPQMDSDKYKSWQEFKEAVNYVQYYVASDSPWFARPESRQMARDWYEKEFGVTMTEEKRKVTTHVIRRKS